MKRYTLTGAQADTYKHEHPDRTARKRASPGVLDLDVTFQVWPSRKAMARSIRMQQQREWRPDDWRAVVPLKDGEGY